MDPDALGEWLKARLTGDQAQADWRRLLEAGFEQALDTPLTTLWPPEQVEALVLAYLRGPQLPDLVRPALRGVLHQVLLEARLDQAPLLRWVPKEAEQALDELAGRPGLVQEDWIRQIFSEKAVEELVADTLYKALIDFSTLVPRLVQSLMPSALGRLSKLGGGVGGRMVEEVEKLLQTEVKRFMGRGTRLALDGAARFAVDHIDDPVSIGTRRSLLRFALSKSGAFHAAPLTEALEAIVERISLAITDEVGKQEESQVIARRVIERLRAQHGEGTVRAFLTTLGVTEAPPYEAWAAATWPTVGAVLAAPEIDRWFRGLAQEILGVVGGDAGS